MLQLHPYIACATPACLGHMRVGYQLSSESKTSQLAPLGASIQQTPSTHGSISASGKQAQCQAQTERTKEKSTPFVVMMGASVPRSSSKPSTCQLLLHSSSTTQPFFSMYHQLAVTNCQSYWWLASSVGPEAVQQAAEEVHEADRQVNVSCGHHLPAVAPHKGNAGVHQPLKQ